MHFINKSYETRVIQIYMHFK